MQYDTPLLIVKTHMLRPILGIVVFVLLFSFLPTTPRTNTPEIIERGDGVLALDIAP